MMGPWWRTLFADGDWVSLGSVSGGTGTILLNATGANRGALATNMISHEGGALIFNGGILRAIGNQANVLQNFEEGTIIINSGGAYIDTDGFQIGIQAPMGGAGGLSKIGEGTLTLTGTKSYAGGIWVQSGTLLVDAGGVISHVAADVFVATEPGSTAGLVIAGGTVRSYRGWVATGSNSTGSVMVHEVGHVLGIGITTAKAWQANVSDGYFVGEYTLQLIPEGVPINGSHIHADWLDEDGHHPIMNPYIYAGTRNYLSDIEYAMLKDLGYLVIPEPSSASMVAIGFGAFFIARRQRRKQAA